MLKDKKILLAEMDLSMAEILRSLLLSMGTNVSIVSDGHSLVQMASSQHPDLIIIDSDIPETDGFKVSQILKTDFLTSYIPVMLLIDKKQIRKKMLEIEHGIDDYIVKPPDPIDLEIRIEMALRRTEHSMHANALTRLPGAREIEKVVNERLRNNQLFSFAYFDISNFKSFNDKYGYVKGDGVIMQSAHIISNAVKRLGRKDDFVAHIGGDDFVAVMAIDKEEPICEKIIHEFDRLIPLHYSKEDRQKGYVRVEDRSGRIKNTPLMNICIAVINNKIRNIHNIIELTEIAFEIKRYLKTILQSSYLIDRRKQNQGKNRRQEDIKLIRDQLKVHQKQNSKHFKPLGQLLLESKIINEEQLNEALHKHWMSGQLLGETLISMGIVKPEQIKQILANKINPLFV